MYICPLGIIFPLKNVNKQGYKIFHKKKNCDGCPLAQECVKGKDKVEIRRNIKQPIYDASHQKCLDPGGKQLHARRKKTVERNFANSKKNYGYAYTTYRKLVKVQANACLSCAAQNMKKMALIMAKREKP